MADETTTGQPANSLIIELYKALYETSIELASSERDEAAIEQYLNLFVKVIMELGDGKDHQTWMRLGIEPDKMFEAELILRLKDDDRLNNEAKS